jgi:hypothetical protein
MASSFTRAILHVSSCPSVHLACEQRSFHAGPPRYWRRRHEDQAEHRYQRGQLYFIIRKTQVDIEKNICTGFPRKLHIARGAIVRRSCGKRREQLAASARRERKQLSCFWCQRRASCRSLGSAWPCSVPTDVMSEPSKRYIHINPTPNAGSKDGTSYYSSSWLPLHRPSHMSL